MANIDLLVKRLGDKMVQAELHLAIAESCTGGALARVITDLPGCSASFDHAIVCYSNASKTRILGVPESILVQYGAVSEETVITMLSGILANPRMSVGLSVSGIAGPEGGTEDKPVGTVYIAWGQQGQGLKTRRFQFEGNREQIREQAVEAALSGLLGYVKFR